MILEHFERALDRVIGGLERKNSLMSPEQRRIVAYHESGHAVAGWFSEHANPLLKVTIVPRASGALGFAQYLPDETRLHRQKELEDMMVMTLGGRAAEQVFFNQVSTGAHDDLKKLTRSARAQVMMFGMSEKLGQVSFAQESEEMPMQISEETSKLIDAEVRSIIDRAYARSIALITEKRDLVERMAEHLLKVRVNFCFKHISPSYCVC